MRHLPSISFVFVSVEVVAISVFLDRGAFCDIVDSISSMSSESSKPVSDEHKCMHFMRSASKASTSADEKVELLRQAVMLARKHSVEDSVVWGDRVMVEMERILELATLASRTRTVTGIQGLARVADAEGLLNHRDATLSLQRNGRVALAQIMGKSALDLLLH